jgi:hypothetical protein
MTPFHGIHEIHVDAVSPEPVDFRVRSAPPPWLRGARMAIRAGGILLVLAVLLFTAVVASPSEPTSTPSPEKHAESR